MAKNISKTEIAIIFAIFVGYIFLQANCASNCEDKGGVYLFREQKCVTGIKEIK